MPPELTVTSGMVELDNILTPHRVYPFHRIWSIPNKPACYAWVFRKEFLYIGKTIRAKTRVKQHITIMEKRLGDGISQCKIYIWKPRKDDMVDLGLLECQLISKLHPKYNKNCPRIEGFIFLHPTTQGIKETPFVQR